MKYIYCGSIQRFIDLIEWIYVWSAVGGMGKGANWKYSNQIEDVIPDYLVIIVGYMMQIMSKSDVVVTCKVRKEFWIKLGSGGPNKPINVQSFANFLFFRLQITWLLKLGSRIDWQIEAVSSNPMILKDSLDNSAIMTVKVFHRWYSPSQNFQCRLPG